MFKMNTSEKTQVIIYHQSACDLYSRGRRPLCSGFSSLAVVKLLIMYRQVKGPQKPMNCFPFFFCNWGFCGIWV